MQVASRACALSVLGDTRTVDLGYVLTWDNCSWDQFSLWSILVNHLIHANISLWSSILRVIPNLAIVTHSTVFTVGICRFISQAFYQLRAGFVLAISSQTKRMASFDVELSAELLVSHRHGHGIFLGRILLCDRLELTIHSLQEVIAVLVYWVGFCGTRPCDMRLVVSARSKSQYLRSFLPT